MPGGLSLRQRLVGFDGRPTRAAKLAATGAAAAAFGLGFLAGPGGAETSPPVAASALEGDVTTASGTAEAPAPALGSAAAVPGLSKPARKPARRKVRAKSKSAPAPAEPVATAEPAPAPTSAPVASTPAPAPAAPAPAAPAPAPAAPKPAPAKPAPNPPSGGGFDSTG